MLMRITPHNGMTLEIDFGNGWQRIGNSALKTGISFRMEDLVIEPESPAAEAEELPLEVAAPAIAPRHWKIRLVRMMRRAVALPCIPLPLAILVLLAALHCVAMAIGTALPIRPIRTITREVFMGHLQLCIAIEAAVMGE